MKQESGNKGSYVEFIVHLPVKLRAADREKVTKAFEEIFFGQDRLAPHIEKSLAGKVDAEKINRMLREDRFVTKSGAASAQLDVLAKQKNLDLKEGRNLFRVTVNETPKEKLRKFAANLTALDGRKSMFVTLRPSGFSVTNEVDLAVLMDSTVGTCRSQVLPADVNAELERAGVDTRAISQNKLPPMTRLSPESRAALEKYGLKEEEFGGIDLIVDPQSDPAESADLLRRQKMKVTDFALGSDQVH